MANECSGLMKTREAHAQARADTNELLRKLCHSIGTIQFCNIPALPVLALLKQQMPIVKKKPEQDQT